MGSNRNVGVLAYPLDEATPGHLITLAGQHFQTGQRPTLRNLLLHLVSDIESGGPGLGKCVTLIQFALEQDIYRQPDLAQNADWNEMPKGKPLEQAVNAVLNFPERKSAPQAIAESLILFAVDYRNGKYPGAKSLRFFKKKAELRIPLTETLGALSPRLRAAYTPAVASLLPHRVDAIETIQLDDIRKSIMTKFGNIQALPRHLTGAVQNYDWDANPFGLADSDKDTLKELADSRMAKLLLSSPDTDSINPNLFACAALIMSKLPPSRRPKAEYVIRSEKPKAELKEKKPQISSSVARILPAKMEQPKKKETKNSSSAKKASPAKIEKPSKQKQSAPAPKPKAIKVPKTPRILEIPKVIEDEVIEEKISTRGRFRAETAEEAKTIYSEQCQETIIKVKGLLGKMRNKETISLSPDVMGCIGDSVELFCLINGTTIAEFRMKMAHACRQAERESLKNIVSGIDIFASQFDEFMQGNLETAQSRLLSPIIYTLLGETELHAPTPAPNPNTA